MPGKLRGYRLSPRAEADLEEIWLYTFKNWSFEQAGSYHNAIIAAFEELAAGRKTGRPVDIREGDFPCRANDWRADRMGTSSG